MEDLINWAEGEIVMSAEGHKYRIRKDMDWLINKDNFEPLNDAPPFEYEMYQGLFSPDSRVRRLVERAVERRSTREYAERVLQRIPA